MGDSGLPLMPADNSAAVSRQLAEHRHLWQTKPGLRAVYEDYYSRMLRACPAGKILEIGGGTGNFKSFADDVLSADIQFAPWLDLIFDGQMLPFAAASLDSIVMIDVLHHMEQPRRFLDEALRVLKPGGRVVMIEPAITLGSWFFFAKLHPEPVDLQDDPLKSGPLNPDRDPWDSNQAIPTILFSRKLAAFEAAFPQLRLVDRQWFSFAAYPLSGGFRSWSLLPGCLAKPLITLENWLEPLFGRIAGFRLLAVLEKC